VARANPSFEQYLFQRGFILAVGVKVRGNESIDRALKRFRRQVNRSRVLREYRQNMAYMKPSEEKRLRAKKSRRRRHRNRGKNRKRK
jgi:small subunit ribosomal protein S21